jgi:DNA polymerase-3 subunit alpha
MSGSFDRFEERGTLLHNLDTLLAYHKERANGRESSQDSLFSGIDDPSLHDIVLTKAEPATKTDMLKWERELLGVYVSGHPLDDFGDEMKKRPSIKSIKSDSRNGIPVVTVGMIETVRELLTKRGDRMAFVGLADQTDSIEMVAFPETYRGNQTLLQPGTCVAVKGRLSIRNDEPTIALEQIKTLAPVSS